MFFNVPYKLPDNSRIPLSEIKTFVVFLQKFFSFSLSFATSSNSPKILLKRVKSSPYSQNYVIHIKYIRKLSSHMQKSLKHKNGFHRIFRLFAKWEVGEKLVGTLEIFHNHARKIIEFRKKLGRRGGLNIFTFRLKSFSIEKSYWGNFDIYMKIVWYLGKYFKSNFRWKMMKATMKFAKAHGDEENFNWIVFREWWLVFLIELWKLCMFSTSEKLQTFLIQLLLGFGGQID